MPPVAIGLIGRPAAMFASVDLQLDFDDQHTASLAVRPSDHEHQVRVDVRYLTEIGLGSIEADRPVE